TFKLVLMISCKKRFWKKALEKALNTLCSSICQAVNQIIFSQIVPDVTPERRRGNIVFGKLVVPSEMWSLITLKPSKASVARALLVRQWGSVLENRSKSARVGNRRKTGDDEVTPLTPE